MPKWPKKIFSPGHHRQPTPTTDIGTKTSFPAPMPMTAKIHPNPLQTIAHSLGTMPRIPLRNLCQSMPISRLPLCALCAFVVKKKNSKATPMTQTPSRSQTFFNEGRRQRLDPPRLHRRHGLRQRRHVPPAHRHLQHLQRAQSLQQPPAGQISEAVKRGVLQAGGFPLEFPTISLGEVHLSPTSMLYRNLAAMDTEEMIRGNPLDGVVLLTNCDKTTPAALMGAASADIPTIMLSGGPMLSGHYNGEILGACTDCRRYTAEYQAGTISADTYQAVEENLVRSAGHCMVMGTASTMNSLMEALGIALPGNGAIPAADSRRLRLATGAGRQIVDLVERGIRLSQIITPAAFDNAITLLHALGGSTNAIVHLPAIAGRLGIDLPLTRFDELSRRTPLIANMRPTGQYQMEDLFYAGGIPAVLKQLLPLLHGDALTVTGRTMAQNLETAEVTNPDIIRSLDDPLQPEGGLEHPARQPGAGRRGHQTRRRHARSLQSPRTGPRLQRCRRSQSARP